MKVSMKSLVSIAVAAVCLAGGAAQADVVIAQARFNTVGIYTDANVIPPADPDVVVNTFNLTSSGAVNSLFNGSFLAFCIDPIQPLSGASSGAGDNSYIASFAGVTALVQRLFDLNFDAAKADAPTSMAFALALQELVLETSAIKSLANGSYQRDGFPGASTTAENAANAMLASVMSSPDAAIHKRIIGWNSTSSQDLMSAIDAPSTNVPEPSGLALMASALVAAAAVARRRNRG